MRLRKAIVGFAFLSLGGSAFAQEEEGQINPNSLLNIPKYEQLYKVKVWRNLDLREKQNKGFFAKGNEFTKLVLDAIKSGEIADIYEYDSLIMKKPKSKFDEGMVCQAGQTFAAWAPTQDFYQGDQVTFNGKN